VFCAVTIPPADLRLLGLYYYKVCGGMFMSQMTYNGTKHSGGPPEDGREIRPKHVEVLYLQTRF
jgi:hypothetical protein